MEKKLIIIPDVHGRTFWEDAVKYSIENNVKIVFLGDYVDCYPDDFIEKMEQDSTFSPKKEVIDVLNRIIDIKHLYPDNIILLIGNHDCGYAIDKDVCQSRRDYLNANVLSEIFKENWDMFQLAHEVTINNKHFVFSHAGISKEFMEEYYGLNIKKDNPVNFLNKIWKKKDYQKLKYLGVYDLYRGWGGVQWASPVWADIRQMSTLTKENTYGDFQIVGHTQLSEDGKAVIFDYIGDFDSRKPFYIDEKGVIRNYETDEELKKYN